MSTSLAVRLALTASVLAALAGCASWWDIGPEPSNFVGPGKSENLVTDPNLKAVVPHVAGEEPGGAAPLPGTLAPAPATATAPGSAPATAPATAPFVISPATGPAEIPESLSVQDAILAGLEHNVNLRVQRLNVPISRTREEGALSAFDPTVNFSLQGGRTQSGRGNVDSISGSATVTEFLPTGTSIQAGITTSNTFYSESALTQGGNITVTQALLRGAGLDVNLATLRKAEISTRISQYTLRGNSENLVSSIENAYWDLANTELQVGIVQDSLNLAQKRYDDTAARIDIGKLSPSELASVKADIAARNVDLITALSNREINRLKFVQLLTPAQRDFWKRAVKLTTLPFIPQGEMDEVQNHVDAAMRFRPDINEALLQLQSGDLEIVRTKNGLLPSLDFSIGASHSGSSTGFGESILRGFDSPDSRVIAGISGDWEPINRSARASYRSAQLSQEQLQNALDNQRQQAELQVRTDYSNVVRFRRQIDATRVARESAQAAYDVQKAKLDAGNGTSLQTSQAANDLLSAQLREVQAVISHLQALVNLYSDEGTLLLRRGLSAPGAEPVTGPAYR
jgi:outer membrane protein TolC